MLCTDYLQKLCGSILLLAMALSERVIKHLWTCLESGGAVKSVSMDSFFKRSCRWSIKRHAFINILSATLNCLKSSFCGKCCCCSLFLFRSTIPRLKSDDDDENVPTIKQAESVAPDDSNGITSYLGTQYILHPSWLVDIYLLNESTLFNIEVNK